jgi:hypothetical protein
MSDDFDIQFKSKIKTIKSSTNPNRNIFDLDECSDESDDDLEDIYPKNNIILMNEGEQNKDEYLKKCKDAIDELSIHNISEYAIILSKLYKDYSGSYIQSVISYIIRRYENENVCDLICDIFYEIIETCEKNISGHIIYYHTYLDNKYIYKILCRLFEKILLNGKPEYIMCNYWLIIGHCVQRYNITIDKTYIIELLNYTAGNLDKFTDYDDRRHKFIETSMTTRQRSIQILWGFIGALTDIEKITIIDAINILITHNVYSDLLDHIYVLKNDEDMVSLSEITDMVDIILQNELKLPNKFICDVIKNHHTSCLKLFIEKNVDIKSAILTRSLSSESTEFLNLLIMASITQEEYFIVKQED